MFKNLNEKQKALAISGGYFAVFAEKETMQEAYDYAISIIDNLTGTDKPAALTAIQVLLNTMAVMAAKELPNAKMIADSMNSFGYKHTVGGDLSGFTEAYCEAVESLYGIETEVIDELERRLEHADDV